MRPISVLFTNNTLGGRFGSEIYVRDVALELLRRGHRPIAFSLVLGDVAAELRRATIPVVDDLTRLAEAPDVIHGHHHLETLIATLAFPGTPVVNFCHGWVPWEEMPLHHPAVQRYVAVDEVCVDRLVREEGIARERVELLLNFVDLDRFQPRSPLPDRPRRALVLSNAATTTGYAAAIIAACRAADIDVDVVGMAAGNPSEAPEVLLRGYDLVFAKARTALEALAVGCAVVATDAAGAGPLVTPDNYEGLRGHNFGIRELRQPHDAAWYSAQINNYCARGAAAVSARVRAEAGLGLVVDRLIEMYGAAMSATVDPVAASRAAAVHCSRIARPLKHAHLTENRNVAISKELETARIRLDAAERSALEGRHQLAGSLDQVRELEARLAAALQASSELETETVAALASAQAAVEGWAEKVRACERELEGERKAVERLQSRLAEYESLPTLRLRDALLRAPVIGSLLQLGARRLTRRLP